MKTETIVESLTAAATDTASFTMPKGDITDLMRSSAISEPLDYQALLDRCEGSQDFVLTLLEEFQSKLTDRVEEIARGVQIGDPKAVANAARELKQSANSLSAKALRNLAGAIQESVGLVSRGCQIRLVERLREETRRCLDDIPLLVATTRAEECAT